MKTIGELLAEIFQRRYDRVCLIHAPSLVDIREFTWQGWNATPQYTYVRLLDSLDIVGELSKNHGKNFRKAARAGYTVSLVENLAERLDAFLVLFENSYKSIPAAYPRHCRFVRAIFQASTGNDAALLYEAKDARGNVQAARIVWPSCHQQVMDWAAATTDTGRTDGATAFLMAKMFEDLRDRGYREFDFCGANTRTIAQYKAGFNARLVPYYATTTKRLSLLNRAKATLRYLKARMRHRK